MLGGKERAIKFDLNAFAELEKRYGTIEKAMEEIQKGGILSFKTLLWAGLIHDEAVIDEDTGEPIKYKVTPYMVGSWVAPGDLKGISADLMEVLSRSMPEEKKDDKPKLSVVPKAIEGDTKND